MLIKRLNVLNLYKYDNLEKCRHYFCSMLDMNIKCEKKNQLKTKIFEWLVIEGPILLFSLL